MIYLAEPCLDLLGLSWALSFFVLMPLPIPTQGERAVWQPLPSPAVSVPWPVGPNTQQPVHLEARGAAAGGKERPPIYFDAPPTLASQRLWR